MEGENRVPWTHTMNKKQDKGKGEDLGEYRLIATLLAHHISFLSFEDSRESTGKNSNHYVGVGGIRES